MSSYFSIAVGLSKVLYKSSFLSLLLSSAIVFNSFRQVTILQMSNQQAQAALAADEKASLAQADVHHISEADPASIALQNAMASERKHSLTSPYMRRIYFTMLVGYLVSTIQGYGMSQIQNVHFQLRKRA